MDLLFTKENPNKKDFYKSKKGFPSKEKIYCSLYNKCYFASHTNFVIFLYRIFKKNIFCLLIYTLYIHKYQLKSIEYVVKYFSNLKSKVFCVFLVFNISAFFIESQIQMLYFSKKNNLVPKFG